jgi:hypothetical protein
VPFTAGHFRLALAKIIELYMEKLIEKILSSKLTRAVLLVLLVTGGSVFFQLFSEYRQNTIQQNILSEDRLEFEKEKSKTEQKIQTKKYHLQRLEDSLKFREKLLTAKENDVKNNKVTVKNALGSYQRSISQHNRDTLQEKETILLKAIDEFVALGVDLNRDFKCNQSNEKKMLFNKALAKYNQIYAIAEANNLKEKYKHFFFHHQQNMVNICPS